MNPSWRSSLGLTLMSASTAFALSRLITNGLRPGIIAPIVLAIIVADQGVALVMRLRLPMVPAIAVGAALSILALLIGADPSLADPASRHFFDWHIMSAQFHAARFALANDGTPLPPFNGVIIAIGALGGVTAAATRSIWEGQLKREPGGRGHIGPLTGCVAPSLGLFIYSTLVSADHGRVPASVAYFAGAGLFVALSDRSGFELGRRRAWRVPTGAVGACVAVLAVVLLAGAGLSGMRLSVFHVTPPPTAPPGAAGTATGAHQAQQFLTGTALFDDLRAVEISESNTVIFTAHSSLPTYWQVGTLTTFDGSTWLPSPGVQAALASAPSANANALGPAGLPVPSNGRTFDASIDVANFVSRLLPAPPHTTSVHGVRAAPVGQEGVLASAPSGPGTSYSLTAELTPTQPSSDTQLPLNDPRLAPYLAVPSEPAVIPFLAHEAVGQAATQGAQVQALVNWFRSGIFRYTLDPPATTGTDPLVQFLTETRAGYCQQFAGAFGIMARSLGIPTRLVVGFTAGQLEPDGSYRITGADAHVWPQVYLGPGTGWISVEPTPSATGDTTSPANVVGPTATPTTTQTTAVPSGSHPGGGAGSGTSPRHTHPARRPSAAAGSSWWSDTLVVIAVAGAALAALVLWRRHRGQPDLALAPDQRIVRAWERAQRALQRKGLGRRVAETPAEYAARLAVLEQRGPGRFGSAALEQLAGLVELACYTPMPCSVGQAEAAQGWAVAVVETNRGRRDTARTPR